MQDLPSRNVVGLVVVSALGTTLIEFCLYRYALPSLVSGPDATFIIPIVMLPCGFGLTILLLIASSFNTLRRERAILITWAALAGCWVIASLLFFLWSFNLRPVFVYAWPGIPIGVPWKQSLILTLGISAFFALAYIFFSTFHRARYGAKQIGLCVFATAFAIVMANVVVGLTGIFVLAAWQALVGIAFISREGKPSW